MNKALFVGFDTAITQSVKEICKAGSKEFLLKPLSKLLVQSFLHKTNDEIIRRFLCNFAVNSLIRKLYQEKWMIEVEGKDLKDLLNKQILTDRDRLERENILKKQKLAYILDKTSKNENENEYDDLETELNKYLPEILGKKILENKNVSQIIENKTLHNSEHMNKKVSKIVENIIINNEAIVSIFDKYGSNNESRKQNSKNISEEIAKTAVSSIDTKIKNNPDLLSELEKLSENKNKSTSGNEVVIKPIIDGASRTVPKLIDMLKVNDEPKIRQRIEKDREKFVQNQNCFNQFENLEYEYENDDIILITNQIMIDYKSKFDISNPIDNLFHLKKYEPFKKPIFVIYNIKQIHRVTLCLIKDKNKNKLSVLCKDSFGDKSEFQTNAIDDLKKFCESHNFELDFKFNKHNEQSDSKSSGIFSLQNTLIIAKNLDENNNFINEFVEFNGFCTQDNANILRKIFADKFAVDTYELKLKDQKNLSIKLKVSENHDSEIEEILSILRSDPSLTDNVINETRVKDDETENIEFRIGIGFENLELEENYGYHFRVELINSKDENKIKNFKNILKNNFALDDDRIEFINHDKTVFKIQNQDSKKIKLRKKTKIHELLKDENILKEKDFQIAFLDTIKHLMKANLDKPDKNLSKKLINALRETKGYPESLHDDFESLLCGVQNVFDCGVEICQTKDEKVVEKERDAKKLLLTTDFSTEKIAGFVELSIERVNELRNEVENELENELKL